MKASKFTDAQKAFVIKQGEEGTPKFAPPQKSTKRPLQVRSRLSWRLIIHPKCYCYEFSYHSRLEWGSRSNLRLS